ncbi:MAG: hypothetical protein NXH88_10020 [Hyphomonas sp.]|nr:hypothetical protein [Hyphomonas sp.]
MSDVQVFLILILALGSGVAFFTLDFRVRRIERKLGIKDNWDLGAKDE